MLNKLCIMVQIVIAFHYLLQQRESGEMDAATGDYMQIAMEHIEYAAIEDGRRIYGEIPGLKGVYAIGLTKKECHDQLAKVLKGWVALRIKRNLPLPDLM